MLAAPVVVAGIIAPIAISCGKEDKTEKTIRKQN